MNTMFTTACWYVVGYQILCGRTVPARQLLLKFYERYELLYGKGKAVCVYVVHDKQKFRVPSRFYQRKSSDQYGQIAWP